jgi:hypothetical protein
VISTCLVRHRVFSSRSTVYTSLGRFTITTLCSARASAVYSRHMPLGCGDGFILARVGGSGGVLVTSQWHSIMALGLGRWGGDHGLGDGVVGIESGTLQVHGVGGLFMMFLMVSIYGLCCSCFSSVCRAVSLYGCCFYRNNRYLVCSCW